MDCKTQQCIWTVMVLWLQDVVARGGLAVPPVVYKVCFTSSKTTVTFTALEHGQQNQQKLLLTLAFCGRIVLSYLLSHLLTQNLFQAFSHSISGFCCPKLVSTCHIHKSLKCLFPSTLALVLGRPRNKEEKRANKFFVSFENQRKTENRSAVDL